MSVEVYVFLRSPDLPTRDTWQKAIDLARVPLTLQPFDVLMHSGFVPVRLHDRDTGFEYYIGVAREVPGVDISRLAGRDRCISFRVGGDMKELQAAMHAAAVLTERFGGVFFDPQINEYAEGSGVFDVIRRDGTFEVDRKRRLAEKDAELTDRRCPQCGAPCPSYRKTCKACGFAVGRAQ
jgi:hypothetical protein